MFLVGFSSKNDRGAPWAKAGSNPTVVEEDFNLFHNNCTLVRAVMGLFATDRWGGASIDSKFEAKDGIFDAFRVKTVPMIFNDRYNGRSGRGVNIGRNDKILGKLKRVAGLIPEMYVGTWIGERGGRDADCFSKFFKEKYRFVNVITVVHGDIAVSRFGAP